MDDFALPNSKDQTKTPWTLLPNLTPLNEWKYKYPANRLPKNRRDGPLG